MGGGGVPHPNLQEPTIQEVLAPPIQDFPDSYRPSVPWNPYYRPQHDVFSPLDQDPIIRRIFALRGRPPLSTPWLHSKYLTYVSVFLGVITVPIIIFTGPYAKQKIEDMVKYDPKYFPEFAELKKK